MAEEKTEKSIGVGPNEVLSVLAPGAMAMLSAGIWVPREGWHGLLSAPHEPSVLITSAFVLVSYGVGLILNAWAVQGWLTYVNAVELMPLRRLPSKVCASVVLIPLTILFGCRYRLDHGQDPEIMLRMYAFVRKNCGEAVSLDLRLFDVFHFVRTFCWDSLQATRARMLSEADLLYRRRLFCHVVGLALVLGSLQIALRLAQRHLMTPEMWSAYDTILVGILVVGALGSIALRSVSFRLLRQEATYTYALFKELDKHASASDEA